LLPAVLIAVLLGWFMLRPTLDQLKASEQRLEELKQMQRKLPVLKRQVADAETALRQAEDQQVLLVDLIAGRDRIQTFLALLDQLSRAVGVEIQQYEPLSAQTPENPKAASSAKQKKPAAEPTDPLMSLGYRKSAVALRVVGSYGALHQFLQEMERLQILVESSDLNLTAKEGNGLVSQTELALRLSFYDLQPPPAPTTEPQSPPEELS
jgi:type IV pilus assembly protein PilO